MTTSPDAPGRENTMVAKTSIASVDSEGLSYRGYAIADLAQQCCFEEVVHLLLYGKLPTSTQLSQLKDTLMSFRSLPSEVITLLRQIPTNVHPMDALRTAVSMTGHFDPVEGDSPDALQRRAAWLTAVVAGIVSARQRLLSRREPLAPKPGLSHAAQVLYQALGETPDETTERVLDLVLVLFAEHGFRASTFAGRVIGSTGSDMVSATVGAIGALNGPLNSGAEQTVALLQRFETAAQASEWVKRACARNEPVPGFGHAIYTHGDPRVAILEPHMRRLAKHKGLTHWLAIYDAVKDPMATLDTPVHPNLCYPCGLVLFLMGMPRELHTAVLAASHVPGWTAHFIEQAADNQTHVPATQYAGPPLRSVAPIEQRQ